MIVLSAVQRLVTEPRPAPDAAHCDVCAQPIERGHAHLIELGVRGVLCSCARCADAPGPRHRAVPDRVKLDPRFSITSERWAELGMPTGLAFVHRDSLKERAIVGCVGASGIVDAELAPATWRVLQDATPLAFDLEDDVEALLIAAPREGDRMSCRLVPVTSVFRLVGELRRRRGDGERAIPAFLAEIDRRGTSGGSR
jgi:hypothetical protein